MRAPHRCLLLGLACCLALPGADGSLVVATKPAPPFVIQHADGRLDGISINLMERIAQDLGLSLEWRLLDLEPMLDAVANHDVDAAISAISASAEREQRMDFSHPYFTTGLGIAVGESRDASWLAVIGGLISWPFLSVLLALSVILLLSGLAVWFFERRRNPDFGGPPLHGIGAGFWWSAVTMTTVGYGDKAPKTLGGRLVALAWMFTSIIIISSFTAAIATSLTLSGIKPVVSSSDDLVSVRSAVIAGSTAAAHLQQQGARSIAVADLSAALDLLEAGKVDAVVHDRPLLRYRIEHEKRPLQVLDLLFQKQSYSIALPEGSPRREAINRSLLGLTAGGDFEALDADRMP